MAEEPIAPVGLVVVAVKPARVGGVVEAVIRSVNFKSDRLAANLYLGQI